MFEVDSLLSPSLTPSNEVVITGVGMITSMGCGWAANSEGFKSGRLALRPVTVFDVSRMSVQLAGEVELPAELPANDLSPPELRRMERGGKLLLHAASEALLQADLTATNAPASLEIVLGTSAGAMALGEDFYRVALGSGGSRRGQLTAAIHYQIPHQAGLLARAFSLSAPTTVISNACASGANALGYAYQMICSGRSEVVIAGGYDALCQLVYAGFSSLKALSLTVPRPFDTNRDGLALGEGAAVFVLENRAHAEARGAKILAVFAGYGASNDCHHLTQPHPAGLAALASMRAACKAAKVEPRNIQYLNSHGTGTPLNDPAEAAAIAAWAGDDTGNISVSSTKGAIGHLLGGAGAVEAAICMIAMNEEFLPPTANLITPDPCCGFDLVTEPREFKPEITLSNSFGFGGSNASLIFRSNAVGGSNREFSSGGYIASNSRLVITGAGAVSPAGWGMIALMEQLKNKYHLSETILEAPAGAVEGSHSCRIRSVPNPLGNSTLTGHPRMRRASPLSLFAAAAGLEALGPERTEAVKSGALRAGLIYTLLNGSVSYSRKFFGEVLVNPETSSPILFPETVFNAPASHLAAYLGITGQCSSLVGDSSQFLAALDMASLLLDLDLVDLVLVIGAEEHDWILSTAFDLVSPGVPLAEGAACIVVERDVPSVNGVSIENLAVRHPVGTFARRYHAATAARIALGRLDPKALLVDDRFGHDMYDTATTKAWADWSGPRLSPSVELGQGLSVAGAWQCVVAYDHLRSCAAKTAVVVTTGMNQRAGALHLLA